MNNANGKGGEDTAAVEALRELLTGSSYTAKKATVRLNQLGFAGGLAERAKVLYVVSATTSHLPNVPNYNLKFTAIHNPAVQPQICRKLQSRFLA